MPVQTHYEHADFRPVGERFLMQPAIPSRLLYLELFSERGVAKVAQGTVSPPKARTMRAVRGGGGVRLFVAEPSAPMTVSEFWQLIRAGAAVLKQGMNSASSQSARARRWALVRLDRARVVFLDDADTALQAQRAKAPNGVLAMMHVSAAAAKRLLAEVDQATPPAPAARKAVRR